MKKLYIDYDKFLESDEKDLLKCSYKMHPSNDGITSLREEISFMFACRRCEDYPCVNACPNGALKRESGLIKRSNLICISCKTCSLACPFGTILPELIPYLAGRCDVCMGRLKEGEVPACVASCKDGSLQYVEEENIEDKKNLYKMGDAIIVRVLNWLDLYGIKK
ncbi:MAG TPA: hypothetical protein PKN36_02740 [bacterium]|nr:hypothetical protein [bacterium]